MKKSFLVSALVAVAFGAWCTQGIAAGKAMTGEQLTELLSGGVVLKLGGEGKGYVGTLKLTKNGKGKGSATKDNGEKLTFSGTWQIEGNQFCRTWKGLGASSTKRCEDWIMTSPRSVDVLVDGEVIGVNSW